MPRASGAEPAMVTAAGERAAGIDKARGPCAHHSSTWPSGPRSLSPWCSHPGPGKRRNRTSPRNQTTTILTRSQKKTIWSKYWRPSRSASGHPPLTSMQAAPTLVRNSPRRKRRLLPVLLQSSSRPRVLVPCRLEVPLPLQVGQVQQQEAWVPGWLRLLDRRRSKSPLTQVLRLFLQS